jgi:hypothetical protein
MRLINRDEQRFPEGKMAAVIQKDEFGQVQSLNRSSKEMTGLQKMRETGQGCCGK